jgi:hypothetical protein
MDEQPIRTLKDPATADGGARLEGSDHVNELAELVADLLEATGLVQPDRLAAARNRAGGGSLAQALVDEGLSQSQGVARVLAERYWLPHVDRLTARLPERHGARPAAGLDRAVAVPASHATRCNGDRRSVNIGAIDELRLAARASSSTSSSRARHIVIGRSTGRPRVGRAECAFRVEERSSSTRTRPPTSRWRTGSRTAPSSGSSTR